jgi:hypothetical protein
MQTIGYQLLASKADLERYGDRHALKRADGFLPTISQNDRLLRQCYAELDASLAAPAACPFPSTLPSAKGLPEQYEVSLEVALLRSIRPNFQLAVSATKAAGALLFFPQECLTVSSVAGVGTIMVPVEKDAPETIDLVGSYLTYAVAACLKTHNFIEIVRERNPEFSSPLISFEQNYDLRNWLPAEVARHMGLIRDLGLSLPGTGSPDADVLRDWMKATLYQKGTLHERFYQIENPIFLARHFQSHALAAIDAGEANIGVLKALKQPLSHPDLRADASRSQMMMTVLNMTRLAL